MHALNRLNSIVRYGNQWRAPKLEGTGIGPCDRPYLFYICHHPGQSQDSIALALCVNKSSAARRLAYLEREGYVTRTPGAEDRRVLLIHPTDKAVALLPALRELSREWNAIITLGCSEEEMEQFASLIERAFANARQKVEELSK